MRIRLMCGAYALLCVGLLTALMAGCTPSTAAPAQPATVIPTTADSVTSKDATPTRETLATRETTPVPIASPQSAGASDEVGQMVVNYLQARVTSDETTLRSLTCAAQEKNIPVAVNSFKGQDASLRDVACIFDGTDKVSCTGQIVLVYDGEEQTREPGAFTITQEDGRWLWCGEAR